MVFSSVQKMSIPIYQIALLSCGLALVGVVGPATATEDTPGEPDKTAAWSKSIGDNLQQFFTTMNKVETLEAKMKEVKAKPIGVFSAINPTSALGDDMPHPADTVLLFKKVFANDNSYSEGIFTAPESGAYFFTFMFHSRSRKSPLTGLSLFKNGDRVVNSGHSSVLGKEMVSTPHHNSAADFVDHGGNSVILQLDKGDTVFIVLDEDMSIWGDECGHNTFSGFHL